MDINELKKTISRKLDISASAIGREDFREYGVRFNYLGRSYRATTDLTVEKVDEACLVCDDDSRRIENMLRREEWNGEGLPPVGTRCEFISNDNSWGEVDVIGIDGDKVVFKPSGETYYGIAPSQRQIFRPIRSEADKKRDEAIEAIKAIICSPSQASAVAEKLYEAISTGKIHVAKLED